MSDMVNHPKHYKAKNGMETIDVIDAFTEGLEDYEAVYTANILKYTCRWKEKNGVEDLKKARWYLDRLITRLENVENFIERNSIKFHCESRYDAERLIDCMIELIDVYGVASIADAKDLCGVVARTYDS